MQAEGNGFDLYNDTRSQVYNGLSSETAATNQAADATRSEVVMYGGKIAETFFSACSGGHTESVQNVFFGSRSLTWWVFRPLRLLLPPAQMDAALFRAGDQRQARRLPERPAEEVVVTRRGASPRIVWARLYGTGGVSKSAATSWRRRSAPTTAG